MYTRIVSYASHQGLIFALMAGISAGAVLTNGDVNGSEKEDNHAIAAAMPEAVVDKGAAALASTSRDDVYYAASEELQSGAVRRALISALGLERFERPLSFAAPALFTCSFFCSVAGLMSSLNLLGFASAFSQRELRAFVHSFPASANRCGNLMVLNCAALAVATTLHIDASYPEPIGWIAAGCFGLLTSIVVSESWFFLRVCRVLRSGESVKVSGASAVSASLVADSSQRRAPEH
jgi:hypothetical protein